ncbi:zinc metalloproteinase nas-13-like [Homalodisca vitripennis]|uniref:zinc metalloproteinase nas-13-like n=1 Tax=Homalodisca vitripennis TaxID=197043 RepID=UPI001EEADCE7|nr:zinc metalloproteinase nas-13-like [Homalodisca vitripennis]
MLVPEMFLLLLAGVSAGPVESTDDAGDTIPKHEPWESTGLFEGDIMEPPGTLVHRNAMKDKSLRWPNGVVPYNITEDFTEEDRKIIRKAMDEIEANSCVTFKERTVDDFDYVLIGDDLTRPGCWAEVGKVGGAQTLNLGRANYCVYFKGVVHELMHTLGFQHQQSASNRDDYVKILWKNILPGKGYNFDKYDNSMITDLGIPYDYNSVTHYAADAFTSNGKDTIEPLEEGAVIYNDGHLSRGDMEKLNIMYNCNIIFI